MSSTHFLDGSHVSMAMVGRMQAHRSIRALDPNEPHDPEGFRFSSPFFSVHGTAAAVNLKSFTGVRVLTDISKRIAHTDAALARPHHAERSSGAQGALHACCAMDRGSNSIR